jgi:ribonucleases P/MRP protein subunit RPP40
MEKDYGVDVFYLDYQKAFDTVPHQRLLKKLRWFGVSGNLLQWIENFIKTRSMRVVTDGMSSSWSSVTSGVPQRSVLEPLLFLIYVNEMPKALNCWEVK